MSDNDSLDVVDHNQHGHEGFYQNFNEKPHDKSSWMKPSQTLPDIKAHTVSPANNSGRQLGRVRISSKKINGHGMVEQLCRANMSVEGSKKKEIHTLRPNLDMIYRSFEASKKKNSQYPGTGNKSQISFGDDRISFKRSMSQEIYRADPARTQNLVAGYGCTKNRARGRKQIILDYKEASEHVGDTKIAQMEVEMRDRLMERTASGPFQLRNTFKKFDRDGSGLIDFSEFGKTLELMGLCFTEIECMALFSRYDKTADGYIDFTEFVNKLMEEDFRGVTSGFVGEKLLKMVENTNLTESEEARRRDVLKNVQKNEHLFKDLREEVYRVFSKIDTDDSGYINFDEYVMLTIALGKEMSDDELMMAFNSLDLDGDGGVDREEFLVWYEALVHGT